MRQERALAAGQHGRHEPGIERDRAIADGVDAAVHTVQPPLPYSSRDGGIVQTARDELVETDHPVLPGRGIRRPNVGG